MIKWVQTGREYRFWRERYFQSSDIIDSLQLSLDAQEVLTSLVQRKHLSGRGLIRLGKIARSIADIDKKTHIEPSHVLEASSYKEM